MLSSAKNPQRDNAVRRKTRSLAPLVNGKPFDFNSPIFFGSLARWFICANTLDSDAFRINFILFRQRPLYGKAALATQLLQTEYSVAQRCFTTLCLKVRT